MVEGGDIMASSCSRKTAMVVENSEVLTDSEVESSSRDPICVLRVVRPSRWDSRAVVGGGVVGREREGVTGRDVCTPMSRWKSSAGSLSLSLSTSGLYGFEMVTSGSETIEESFVMRVVRFVCAVSARLCLEVVRDSTMGFMRYLLLP